MADGDDKDDLFEDLDKFFAPIQDVDWPEPAGSAAAGSAPPSPPSEEPSSVSAPDLSADEGDDGNVDDQTSVSEEPILIGDALESETVDLPPEEPMFPPEPATPSWPPATDDESEDESNDESDDDEGVSSFLFASEGDDETDDEEEAVADLSVDSFSQAPEAYVDLPGAEGEDVAELDEGQVAVPEEEAPSREAIEAAAEHFAESVRDEVRIEPVDSVPAERVDAGLPAPEGIDESALPDLEEPSTGQRTVRVGGEGLGGPSWQEPTAIEVARTTRGARRDATSRWRSLPASCWPGSLSARSP